ncbi:carbon catabolite repressor protein 4 homolog 4 [Magnolia sinica]|uniref:carbon catabolite repressor protein 4 homolog 4 n=1 Tax=Magnolia sinica TaxID=86752 RepID=UPI00265911DE|nr:carbon catabolite repressor protein 4 homolog 4 [Magnolia sinica]
MFVKGLKLLPRLSVSAPQRNCVSKMSGAVQPLCPKFISLEDRGSITKTDNSNSSAFRVVSYNILAQVYVKSSLFPHSPSPCLKWKARSQSILTVLNSLDADFLCIQELDEYDTFYKGKMESQGYSSIYIQRSGQKRDGCGIFYKPNSAELMLEELIQYNDLVKSVEDETECGNKPSDPVDIENRKATSIGLPQKDDLNDRGDPNDPRVRLKRDCVGIMAAFKLNGPHHLVIVANTHIYWDPEWADVKLAQVKYLLQRLSQFKAMVSNKFNCTPSVIVAGDFNSTPEDTVYQYLVSRSSSTISPTDSDEERPMPLCSLHAFIGGEPPFTNCTPDFTGTLDYIFFSDSGSLKPISFLELPGPESPDVVGGLPNYDHPSDHLPIGADFEVIRP